jgi:predicted dehydrogenase
MPKLRAAIVGAGKIAGLGEAPFVTHAEVLTTAGPFVLEGVCEPDEERRRAFSERWGVSRRHGDLEGLLADGAWDLIAVCSPDSTHAAILGGLLSAPRPPRLVVLEKPPCVTPSELDDLSGISSVPVVVNLTRRFDAGHLALKNLMDSQELGELIAVRWVYYGGWLHNGIHVVDTLGMLLGPGLEVRSVRRGYDGRCGDPCLEGEFRAERHPGVSILVESFPETAYQLLEGEFRFRDGRARLLDFGAEIVIDRIAVNSAGERELKVSATLKGGRHPAPMRVLYECCADHLATGSTTVIEQSGLAIALESMRILFAARERMEP